MTASRPGTNNSPILISDLVINELMYDPISGNDDDQFIELYNHSTNVVNLGGWQFSAGVTFTFPNIVIAPDVTVLSRNATICANYSNLNAAEYGGEFQRQTLAQRRAGGLVHAGHVEHEHGNSGGRRSR